MNFYNKILGVLLFVLITIKLDAQTTCATAYEKVNSVNCSFSQHEIEAGNNQFWVKFTPQLSEKYLLKLEEVDRNVSNTTVQIYSGTCSSLTQIASKTWTSNSDSLLTTNSLVQNQTYYIKFNFTTTTDLEYLKFCIAPKAIGAYWTNYFFNSDGQHLNCQTLLPIDYLNETYGNQNCNEVTICKNETMSINLGGPGFINSGHALVAGQIVPHIFQFIQQNGATYTTNGTTTTLSFSQVGDVTFQYYPTSQVNTYIIGADAPAFTFTIHVVDSYANAVWEENNILCAGEIAYLVPQIGTTLTNLVIDGINRNPLIQNNQAVINGSSFGVGVHTVSYTLNGACGPKTLTTTFQIISNNQVNYTIDGCGNAVWEVSSCNVNQNIEITIFNQSGLETVLVQPINPTGNTFEYQFSNNGPYTWNVIIAGTTIQSGSTPSVTPINVSILGNSYVCELNNGLSVPTTPFLQNLQWNVSPFAFFDGQGTSTILPIGIWNQNADYTVTVTGTDINGCKYTGQKLITSCCTKKVTTAEVFERTYVSSSTFAAPVIPDFLNKAPTSVVIDLPPISNITNIVNTPYSSTSTVSQLKVLLGLAPTANMVNITNKWIYINNDLILDQNLIINNCPFIRFAPGVRLIIPNGYTLEIINSTLAARCEKMWQGIVLQASGSILKTNNNTNILEALVAVESNSGAVFQVDQTRFIDNAKGIVVKNFTGNHLGTVKNSYFGDHISRNLFFPHQTQSRPFVGIEVNRTNITIGAPNTNPTFKGGNLFHRQDVGIRSIQANVTVNGNTFYHIAIDPTNINTTGVNDHKGIYATGPALETSPKNTLNLGSLDSKLNCNNFIACGNAVNLNNNMNANIHSNFFKDIIYTGVWGENNATCNITVRSNYFGSKSSDAYGVRLLQYTNGTINLERNQVNQVNFTPNQSNLADLLPANQTAQHIGAGIFVSNVALGKTPINPWVNITFNKIDQAVYGVMMYNVNKPYVYFNEVKWNFSTALILSDQTYDYTGVFAAGCSNAIIENNDIRNLQTYDPQTSSLGEFDLAGIRLENSFKARVKRNYIHQVPAGLFARFQNGQSEIHCNEFYKNEFGFKFDQTELGDQGLPPAISSTYPSGFSADNKWTGVNTTLVRSDGTRVNAPGTSMKYYWFEIGNTDIYKSIPTFLLDVPNYYDDVELFVYNNERPYSPCPTQTMTLTIEDESLFRELSYGNFIENENMSTEEQKYAEREVYKKMKEDSAYMNMGNGNDQKYIQFVSEYAQTDGALSLKVQEKIAQSKRDSAAYYNAQISQHDQYRVNNKHVQALYLSSWQNSDSIFLPSENTRLQIADMACQDPWIAGDAVYQARAIMGWLRPCDARDNFGFKNGKIEASSQENVSINVFPNPSSQAFTIEFPKSQEILISLFDLNGKLLQEVELSNTDTFLFKHALNAGIYVLKVQLNQESFTQKIHVE